MSRPGQPIAGLFRHGESRAIAGRKVLVARNDVCVGYGKAFGSFGEIVQGRLSNNEDFLVTLPVDLWSTCEITCTTINGPVIVECDLAKSRSVVSLALDALGITRGYHLAVQFTRNIPIGKGLSSSTADMLASLRALQEIFGFLLRETYVSRLFSEIEPHDALHYNNSVVYNHRQGRLLHDLGYIPRFHILAVDGGGEVDTVDYNRRLKFAPDDQRDFDALLTDLLAAFKAQDDAAIAACATRSARIHVRRTGSPHLARALEAMDSFGPSGILATHSGTCAGFLYPIGQPREALDITTERLRQHFGAPVFATRSLDLLQ